MKAISSYMLSGISVLSLVLIGSCCSPQHSMDSYRGRALALWLDDLRSAETQEDYARASNAVHRIGRNAVPFLRNRPAEPCGARDAAGSSAG